MTLYWRGDSFDTLRRQKERVAGFPELSNYVSIEARILIRTTDIDAHTG
jgi:hypothetical protein